LILDWILRLGSLCGLLTAGLLLLAVLLLLVFVLVVFIRMIRICPVLACLRHEVMDIIRTKRGDLSSPYPTIIREKKNNKRKVNLLLNNTVTFR
jgi:hypothetical protein